MAPTIQGFATGFSLILAIGAQNAFILRQGLRGEHVFILCLTCAVSDALLIAAGVIGLDAVISAAPWIDPVFRYGGAAFLVAYGARAAQAAWRGGAALAPAQDRATPLWPALATCLALTWLNPHVYLDTVLLVGSLAAQSPDPFRFGLGAVLASFVFFFGLGYGARILRPVFTNPQAWRALEALVAALMWAIAASLIFG
ncbi:MAG: LysE/ArgO family amino acid transporter [Pseudomonadota bacterium]